MKKENNSYTEQELQHMQSFKPVSLKTIARSGEYCLQNDDYYGFRNCLDDKWWCNYEYDGIDETLSLYEQLWEKYDNERELTRIKYMRKLVRFIGTETEEAAELLEYQEILEELSAQFYQEGTDSILGKIEKLTYLMSDVTWNYMIQLYFTVAKKTSYLDPGTDWVGTYSNMGYLKERIEEPDSTFIVVADENNVSMCKAIGRLLCQLDKTVYFLEVPVLIPEMSARDADLIMQKSIDSIYRDDLGINVVSTYCIDYEGGQRPDDRAMVINYLSQQTPEKLATVIASGNIMNDLEMEDCMKKSFTRFNMMLGDIFEDNFSVGWCGDYISYISKIYNYNVRESLYAESTCRYSIVVPARNSSDSLRYTLQTCLALDYPEEDYEIVVSDNSTNNSGEVYNLCQELNDARIKYCRTPRDLHLPKSFEYAFLQTKGEFVFSLGSDDGVLPWALRVLDDIREKYPDEDIIQWERGFYAWPGFNGGQQHQFVVPRAYQQNAYNVFYKNKLEYMVHILKDPGTMYLLPMLYINSGFKRSYMQTLLDKTGRLWDGICQDIYMGIINVCINEQILNIQYPLTIAGMTGKSIGATCAAANTDDKQARQFNDDIRKTNNIGGFSMSMTERLMPELRSDVSSLYNSLLRAVARGVLSEEYLWQIFDWKKMFAECINRLDIRDVEYDKLIHYARYTASWHGNEFLQWFDENIYDKAMMPRQIDEEALEKLRNQKSYREGIDETGGITADASKYGVQDIFGAVRLFEQLSGLH